MKQCVLTAGWCLALLVSSRSFALERENLRLCLSFENTLKPLVSRGQTQVTVTGGTEKEAAFVEGKRGQAIKVKPGLSITYANREMFSPKEGTVACWVQPAGWRKGDGLSHSFLRICGDTTCFLLYKFYPGNTWVYLEGGGKTGVVGGWWDEWEEGKWTFLAFTFKPGEQCWYINGQLQTKRTDQLIEPEFSKAALLQVYDGQVLDEAMTFDRALTEQEVKAVYRANR